MKEFYTVEQISTMLSIHPKTVQRYIREGKLHATKIGKSWRVAGHDLSLFVEQEKDDAFLTENAPVRNVIASSVVDITVCGKEEAIRIMNTLTAALNTKPAEYGESSMQTQYIERERMIRITLWGRLRFMVVMMDTIDALAQPSDKKG